MSEPVSYAVCAVIGAIVGLAELIGRYRDQPRSLFRFASSWVYLLLNGTASVAALYLTDTFHWTFELKEASTQLTVRVLISSFGAMALLRSSFFNLKVDDQIVPIGPSAILASLLSAADRGVDRMRASSRSEDASSIMGDVSFGKSHAALPTVCLALLQNVSPIEQQKLREAVDALRDNKEMTDRQKSISLGLLLMNLVGPAALRSAVNILRDEIQATTKGNEPPSSH